MQLGDYTGILILGLLGLVFGLASFYLSSLLAPRRPTPEKLMPYECGIVPEFEPPQRFPVQFYLIAVIFIAFDIEVIFLYPWAVRLREFGLWGWTFMTVFVVVLFVPFVYVLREGVLDWAPREKRTREELLGRYRSELQAGGEAA